MPYLTNPYNGKKYFRSPDRNYKKNNKVFCVLLCLVMLLDIYASVVAQSNPHLLDILTTILSPVSWLSNAVGVPITGDFFDGQQPSIYYRVLMIDSALFGITCGLLIAKNFCTRSKFFRFPAYSARLAQRNASRHHGTDISSKKWFFVPFLRIFYLSIIFFSVAIVWAVYPGRITFHVNGFLTPLIISLMPATIWCLLPVSILGFISCLCSDIDTIKKIIVKQH